MTGFLSAIAAFWKSLFQRKEVSKKPQQQDAPDVDDVAREFYNDMLDWDRKSKKQ